MGKATEPEIAPPRDVAQFRRWLEWKIAWLQDYPAQERIQEDHEHANGFINDAYEHAVNLRLPAAADACRQGPVTVRLLECLNAIPEPPDLGVYNLEQAAERLGVSRRTVGRLIASGELQCNRVGSRKTITKKQLADYQDQKSAADSESLFG